jgi:hypothetical protein
MVTGGGDNYSFYNSDYEYDEANGYVYYGSQYSGMTLDPSLDDYLINTNIAWQNSNFWEPVFGGEDIYNNFSFGIDMYPYMFGGGSIATNPFGNYKWYSEYSSPVFRHGIIVSTQGFTKRNVSMTIYVPYRYGVQYSKYTGLFKFIYGSAADMTPTGTSSIFGLSGSKMGEVSENVYGSVDLDPGGFFAFYGNGHTEKRTAIISTTGQVKMSANVNLNAFPIGATLGAGAEVGGSFTISSVDNAFNLYYVSGYGNLSTSGNSQRPTYTITWNGISVGPQIE